MDEFQEKIIERDIEEEMRTAYIDYVYSLSSIISPYYSPVIFQFICIIPHFYIFFNIKSRCKTKAHQSEP